MTDTPESTPHDLDTLRMRLSSTSDQRYWRSLNELADTSEFRAFLHREFPRGAAELSALDRRTFLKLMGASLALAGLSACAQPREQIVPYVQQPEQVIPGKPLFYATALLLGGYATGVLVESHTGRPTKIEGNPRHPASLGAADAITQAAVLTLYDPDRSQTVVNVGRISTWEAFVTQLASQLQALGDQGAGLRLLTEVITSPALAAQIQALLARYPAARWHQYQPVARDNALDGARFAFGQPVNTIYRFDRAERVLALDADFLLNRPGSLRYACDFAEQRRVRADQARMSRLYAVESTPTLTGAAADHRLPLRAAQIAAFARAVAAGLGVAVSADVPDGVSADWIDALVQDLQAHRGASIVIVGDEQPPFVHALAHAMNQTLGNVGATVLYTPPVEAAPVQTLPSLQQLVGDMDAGQVSMLVMIGGNPVFDAPADLGFVDALSKVGLRIHLGLYADETANLAHWHIPAAHELESWGDARAFDGTVSIIQPLIAPLYGGKSAHELLAALLGNASASDYEIVRAYWQSQAGSAQGNFEQFWRKTLNDGLVENSAFAPINVTLNANFATQAPTASPGSQGLEIIFRPDPTIWDGRFANNGWLQELPKPLTTLTWDNVAMLSPATATRLDLASEDVVELRYAGRSVRAPVWVAPGHADDSVTVFFGYGRTHSGKVGDNTGFNVYAIRTAGAPWFDTGLELVKTGEQSKLAASQEHFSIEGRDLIKTGTLDAFQTSPRAIVSTPTQGEQQPSLLPPIAYSGNRWGMTIDTNVCIGCNACVSACQAENNIPVVGKEQVLASREMHWLKIDLYYEGAPANPQATFQPRPCMQCEQAPCELVCPVGATVHSADGLNDMVYNRCVGTRYCSNNCPYKVRRFNFFQYADKATPVIQLLYNPDVTVRDRGVMEKCTYCVQRINAAKIAAEQAGQPIHDGAIKTACQEACPTQAIMFGDINDTSSQVAQLKAEPLNYRLLDELGTQPRTSYLAKLRNPNPALKA